MNDLYPPRQQEHRRSLVLSQEKITQIAFMTTGQRENSLWAAARKLRFIASNFGQIIAASKRNRLFASLKKRLLSAYNLQKRAPIQWGKMELEAFGFMNQASLGVRLMGSFNGIIVAAFTFNRMNSRYHRGVVPFLGQGHDCYGGMPFKQRLLP
ncbi:hypothetical protein MAR_035428, partial [Mya arenaria]